MQPKSQFVNGNTVSPSSVVTNNGSTTQVPSENPFSSEVQKELPPKVNEPKMKHSSPQNNLVNSKEVSSTSATNKKVDIDSIAIPDSSEDPYSYLDWKDGIGTLPGMHVLFTIDSMSFSCLSNCSC